MRVLAGLVGLALAFVAIAAFAPASLVAERVATATRGEVRLADARGTVWNGTADAVMAGGRASLPVAWRLEAWPLARGEARIALRPRERAPGATADVVVREGTLEARAVDLTLPAQALRLPVGALAGGEVRVSSDALALARGDAQGSVRIAWSRARLALPGLAPIDLGDVTATLGARGAQWRGPLSARGGTLVVDGEASVNGAGADVALTIVPQPGTPEALLRLLGSPDAGGAIRLRATPRFH